MFGNPCEGLEKFGQIQPAAPGPAPGVPGTGIAGSSPAKTAPKASELNCPGERRLSPGKRLAPSRAVEPLERKP
jgi:hypothetical protein